jgi:Ala-tRNA(Pro) deacylase
LSVVTEYLKHRGVPFEVIKHEKIFASVDEAKALGISADEALKTLVIDRHRGHALVVVPASRRVDMRLVRRELMDPHAHLATESELEHDFVGYDLGAMPPIGSLVGADVYVDPEVLVHETVIFAGGSQTESIKARTADLFRSEPITVVPLTETSEDAKEYIG